MGKECGAWVSRRVWGGGNTSPLKTTAWEAIVSLDCQESNSVISTSKLIGSYMSLPYYFLG